MISGLLVLLLLAPWTVQMLFPLDFVPQIKEYSRQHDLDPYLVSAVIRVESGFRPHSRSTKDARGLMQIMPSTGQWVAGQMGLDEITADDLYDPTLNIMLGTWYLADLSRAFDGDVVLMLAAYNGGRGNVQRWLAEHRATTGQGEFDIEAIPFPETRAYVQRVLIMYRIYKIFYPSLDVA